MTIPSHNLSRWTPRLVWADRHATLHTWTITDDDDGGGGAFAGKLWSLAALLVPSLRNHSYPDLISSPPLDIFSAGSLS